MWAGTATQSAVEAAKELARALEARDRVEEAKTREIREIEEAKSRALEARDASSALAAEAQSSAVAAALEMARALADKSNAYTKALGLEAALATARAERDQARAERTELLARCEAALQRAAPGMQVLTTAPSPPHRCEAALQRAETAEGALKTTLGALEATEGALETTRATLSDTRSALAVCERELRELRAEKEAEAGAAATAAAAAAARTTVMPLSLTVPDLRAELAKRGLPTQGKKGELVARLEEAIATHDATHDGLKAAW